MSEIAKQLLHGPDRYDIIGLQELWMSEDYRFLSAQLRHKYPHSAYSYSGAVGSGLALFSRYPIRSTQFRRYSVGGRPEHIFKGDWFAAKGIAISQILMPNGEILALLNTHMAASYNRTVGGYDCYETHRLVHAYEFGRAMQEASLMADRVVGFGDFNLQPASAAYRAFLSDEAGFINPSGARWVRSAFNDLYGSEPQSFNALQNTYSKSHEQSQAIDHIFSVSLRPVSAKMTMTGRVPHYNISLSDHFGISATFELDERSETEMHFGITEAARMNLSNAIGLMMESKVEELLAERTALYEWSVFLIFVSITCLAWSLFLTFNLERPFFRGNLLRLALLGLASILLFILAFLELFKGFAFVGEELAAHKQFLADFSIILKN